MNDKIIDFPKKVDVEELGQQADEELTNWCCQKIEEGIPVAYLVGILFFNAQFFLTSEIIEEE